MCDRRRNSTVLIQDRKEDKAYEDKMNSLIGFLGFGAIGAGTDANAGIQKLVCDPKEDKSFPADMTISSNRSPQWTEDLGAVLFGIREPKKKEPGATSAPATENAALEAPGAPPQTAEAEDMPDLVLWHYQDKRLQSQQQVQANSDQNFSYLSEYRIKEKRFIRLAD